MPTKTNGAEYKRFYTDDSVWPDGAYHDDEELIVDGASWPSEEDAMNIPDASVVEVSGGVVFLKAGDDDGPSMESYFKRWRKKQTVIFFTCEVPRENVEAMRAAIKSAGGRAFGL